MKMYLTIYTLPYFPFPISRSFLKSDILRLELMLALGDWHFVESDSLNYFSSRVDISLNELNYFFFKKRLLGGFQVELIFLLDCICEGFFSAERKFNLSVELRKLGVLNDYFLKVNVLELIGLS